MIAEREGFREGLKALPNPLSCKSMPRSKARSSLFSQPGKRLQTD